MTRIDVLAFDGCDELDVVGPWQVLRTAVALGAPFDVRLVHTGGAGRVVGLRGLELGPCVPVEPYADVLVVPGAGCPPPPGLTDRVELTTAIAAAAAAGTVLASVCTGAFLLAKVGLLRDRRATTHFDAIDALLALGADAVDARVVDIGDVVTSGGVTSGIELGLHLVNRFAGAELAYLTSCGLDHEPRGALVA